MSVYKFSDFQFIGKCKNCGNEVHGIYFPATAQIMSFDYDGHGERRVYDVDVNSVQFYTGLKLNEYKLYTDDILKVGDKLGVIKFGTYNEWTDEEPKWKQGIYVEFEDGSVKNILDVLYLPETKVVKKGDKNAKKSHT